MGLNKRRKRKKHCPHSTLIAIPKRLSETAPGGRCLLCQDCHSFLDGPVWLADQRRPEWDEEADSQAKRRYMSHRSGGNDVATPRSSR